MRDSARLGGSCGLSCSSLTRLPFRFEGAEVLIASRSEKKLAEAKKKIGKNITTKQLDFRDRTALEKFFSEIGAFNHLQISASDVKTSSFLSSFPEEVFASFESKFWGPYFTAKYAQPYINKNEDASITFYSGAFSQRPIYHGASVLAAINGAIESLAKALAVELAPIRINVISPGLTLTEHLTNNYSPKELEKLVQNFSNNLVIKRMAKSEEIAKTAIYLMSSTYTTGSTLFTDGGFTLI